MLAKKQGGYGLANRSEHKDGNQLGVSAGCIFGMKKTVFNSVDYGVVTMPTYAVAS